jgi:hypothetical protein
MKEIQKLKAEKNNGKLRKEWKQLEKRNKRG